MKKVIKNLFASFLGQIITVILGLIIPRLVLTSFGSDVNGLINSTSQLFAYIALLEAGVGTATLQALYAPIAKSSHQDINRILAATDHFYRRTGSIYFLCVIILAFGYPLVVKTDIANSTIIMVILLQGMSGVLNYFFQGKYRILLQAEGKNYILTNLATVVQILVGIGKVVVISLGFDIVAVQFVYFLINVFQMTYILYYIRKEYRWINLKIIPNYDAISQKYDVFVGQISSLVFNNTDSILLTLFCDLKAVSVYSIYLMLCNMINTVVDNISASVTFKFGEIYSLDVEKFKKIQKIFERYYLCLIFWLYNVTFIFIIPFLTLYTRGVSDTNYLDEKLALLFVIMQLISYSKRPFNQVVNMAQKFKETKWPSVAEAVINLGVSLIAVHKYGIYGVLIGSIVALIYRLLDLILYTNKVMNESSIGSIKNIFIDVTIFVVIWYVASHFVTTFSNYISLFISAGIVTIVSGVLFIGINSICSLEDTKYMIEKIRTLKK